MFLEIQIAISENGKLKLPFLKKRKQIVQFDTPLSLSQIDNIYLYLVLCVCVYKKYSVNKKKKGKEIVPFSFIFSYWILHPSE